MISGKKFRLKSMTFAVDWEAAKRELVYVKAGEDLQILSCPSLRDTRMMDVSWNGRTLAMFTDDVRHRGEEVRASLR